MVSIAEIPSVGGATAKDCGTCNPNSECGNGLEKVYPTCAIRYGAMGLIGEFRYAPGMLFGCGKKVVILTDRGTEIGEQKSLTCSGCSKSIDRDQIRNYVKTSGKDFLQLHAGKILRVATNDDLAEDEKQQLYASEMLREAKQLVRKHELEMKMVLCEYLFGGERAVFYFMSEDRVDFRELVRELAAVYHTRIELRQIGARDEARLVADYEICGRECCCKNFLKTLRPIKMEMAKLQKATLDPSKVSGRCGRLRCCLRYEHETYTEMNKRLPRQGRRVLTQSGPGTVVDRQILTQLLLIHLDDDRRVTIPIEEILEGDPGPYVPRSERQDEPSAAERREQQRRGKRGKRGGRRGRSEGDENAGGDAESAEGASEASGESDAAAASDSADSSTSEPRESRRNRRSRSGGGEPRTELRRDGGESESDQSDGGDDHSAQAGDVSGEDVRSDADGGTDGDKPKRRRSRRRRGRRSRGDGDAPDSGGAAPDSSGGDSGGSGGGDSGE